MSRVGLRWVGRGNLGLRIWQEESAGVGTEEPAGAGRAETG